MQLWDIAGPERFTSVTPIYYRGAKGLVLVYDIADLSSFNATAGFLQEIQWYEVMFFQHSPSPLASRTHARTQRAYRHAPEDVSVVLVGNKTDLAPDKRVVTEQMGRCVADTHANSTHNTHADTRTHACAGNGRRNGARGSASARPRQARA
jgi:GTPase SAR1 family protein